MYGPPTPEKIWPDRPRADRLQPVFGDGETCRRDSVEIASGRQGRQGLIEGCMYEEVKGKINQFV
jgi:hypothetical protein